MAGLIDPSVLLGARGIQLPDPMALAQQSMTLAELADRRRMREYQMAQAARQDEAARALEAAMPGAIRAGFSDESIAGADPRAQAALLAAAEKYRKNRADVGKTEAETDEKRVKALRERFATIGGNAFELSQKPDLTPDDVGAFVSHARSLGLSAESLGGMPAGDQASMRAYLRGIADKSVGALDKLKLAGDAAARSETNRHNTTTEGLTATRDAATAAGAEADRQQRKIIADMQDKRARDLAMATQSQADATREAANSKRVTDTELKLADDYRQQSKGFQETAGAITKVKAALKTAATNPGSALAAGTAFMKILDPNSVVRESELGMALNASGWFDRATNVYQQLLSGKIMTPNQVKNLEAAADDLFAEAAATQRSIDASYIKKTRDYGGDPARVIIDLGQNGPKGRPAAGPAVGQSFPGLPDPQSLPVGAVIRDDKGNRLRNTGNGWTMVK